MTPLPEAPEPAKVGGVIFSRHTIPNAFRAFAKVVQQIVRGPLTVSDEVRAHRLVECIRCSHFDGSQCKVCTCFVELKTRVSTERCPIGRWDPSTRPYRIFEYIRNRVRDLGDVLRDWARSPSETQKNS